MYSRRARVIFTQRQQNGSHQRKTAQSILVAGACFAICVLTARAGLAAEAIESCVASGGNFNPAALKHDEKIRQFEFEYASKAVGLKPGANVRVWLPIPPTNHHQSVSVKGCEVSCQSHDGSRVAVWKLHGLFRNGSTFQWRSQFFDGFRRDSR